MDQIVITTLAAAILNGFMTAVSAQETCSPGYYLDPDIGCQACPSGKYMPVPNNTLPECYDFTNCHTSYNKKILTPGSPIKDNVCGECIPGHVDPERQDNTDPDSFPTTCVSCSETTPEVRQQYQMQCPTPAYKLSVGAIAGIVVASLVVLVALLVGGYKLHEWRKERFNDNIATATGSTKDLTNTPNGCHIPPSTVTNGLCNGLPPA